jgi:outer membrane receptor for ferrienterochelin and colicin
MYFWSIRPYGGLQKMASNQFAKGLKRSALTVALGLCFAGGVQAQTNTAGAVTGHAASGDTILITSPSTGFSRTITVGADGNYRFSALPTGQYTVTRNGGSPRTVTVSVGTATTVDFAADNAATLDAVTVVGTQINPIDVSSVESTTILTAEQIQKIPVAQNTTAVALLAPGTVRGDAAFGNLASFGGSAVSENQYYVNGFNITNSFKNLDFAQIPFEAIAEQQVKTGGYGAEFGRSTGGVINQITKRGTNEFHAGGKIEWEPESLSEEVHNTYTNTGVLRSDNSKDNGWSALASVWAGGALIKDRLFAYGLLQYARTSNDLYPTGTTGVLGNNTTAESKEPKWLLKLDWSINDNNMLEFTGMGDKRKFETDYFFTTYANEPVRGAYRGTEFDERGGEAYVLKYTGYLTDNFTLSALYGHGEASRSNYSVSANGAQNRYSGDINAPVPGCPRVIDSRPGAGTLFSPYPNCFLATTLGRPDAGDTRDQFRVDAELTLGDHLLRAGIDTDKFESIDGSSYSGGHLYRYFSDGYGLDYRVQQGAKVEVDSKAFYLEDSWSVTNNFLIYAGLRWDSFENKNGSGDTYVEIKNQFAPRLGFSWDVFGDSSFKVFGNAGRYALPIASTVAVRGASASLFSYRGFYYDGVDPVTGAPQNLTYLYDEQFVNNEFGVAKDPRSIASQNLKPMYQDEYILGFQKQLTDNFSMGVRGIYRDLKRAIDDTCDYRAVVSWAIDHGFTVDPVNGTNQAPDPANPLEIAHFNKGFPNCRLYNPGQPGIYTMDVNGDGVLETVNIPANYTITNRVVNGQVVPLMVPNGGHDQAAKRTYSAIEVFWQGNWDKLFFQGSYTYARSKGNTEGGVKSDIGQDDTGVTQDFDYPELTLGSYGYLPNDRRHSLKLFGSWEVTDEWRVGANLLVQSGRPENCIGIYGDDPVVYRVSYFSCNPGVLPSAETVQTPGTRNNGYTIVPRGTAGRLPWTKTLDLNVTYQPAWMKGLSLKVDVFNVLNSREAINVSENGEDSLGRPIDGSVNFTGMQNTYLAPTNYQTPRSVRFTARYEF